MNSIKIENIEIKSARLKTLDNGACGVEVEWTTPEIMPEVRYNLYALSYPQYKDYLCKDILWEWCKVVVYENEIENKFDYIKVIKDIKAKAYLFHGTNAELLDDFLVRGTFFTDNLEIAMKYGKNIYVVEINKQSCQWFKRTDEGHFQSLGRIPLSYCIKLIGGDNNNDNQD